MGCACRCVAPAVLAATIRLLPGEDRHILWAVEVCRVSKLSIFFPAARISSPKDDSGRLPCPAINVRLKHSSLVDHGPGTDSRVRGQQRQVRWVQQLFAA